MDKSVLTLSCGAGICASGAATLAKLSSNVSRLYVSAGCIAGMLLLNVIMWILFSKALNASTTSIVPTVVSAAVNYIFSGVVGVILFKEYTSLTWWSALGLVLLGLIFITKGAAKNKQL